MTAFRNRRLAVVLVAGALTAIGSPGIATAQTQPPPQPQAAPAQPAKPLDLIPPAALRAIEIARAGDDQRANAAANDPNRVQVRALGMLDPAALGLLDEGNGGLGATMWAGTDRRTVLALMPRLPVGSDSPTMHALARRLLLSAAAPPPVNGTREDESNAPPRRDTAAAATTAAADADPAGLGFLRARIERLQAAGLSGDVAALLRLVPGAARPRDMTTSLMRARLLLGDTYGACRLAQDALAEQSEPLWLQTLAFCLALEGKTTEAELYENLLAERRVTDPVFAELLATIAFGGDPAPESMIAERPLQVAMLRAAKLPLRRPESAALDRGIDRAIATMSSATPAARLAAAERAEAIGALETETLRQIYASLEFSADQRLDVLGAIGAMPDSQALALIWQEIQTQATAGNQLALLDAAWLIAERTGRMSQAARIFAPVLRGIRPDPDTLPRTAQIGRALIAAGDLETARVWIALARRNAEFDDADAARALTALWPLMQVAHIESDTPYRADVLMNWLAAFAEMAPDRRAARLGLLFSIFEGLGYTVPDSAWQSLLSGTGQADRPSAAPAYRRALAASADALRTGEVVLLSLAMLGDGGPGAASADSLGAVVEALREVGLDAEARRLAIEAMIARGF